jgi:hypothetical protein
VDRAIVAAALVDFDADSTLIAGAGKRFDCVLYMNM